MAEEIIPVLDVDLPATPAEDEGVQTVEDADWVDPFLIKHLNQAEYTGSGSGNYFSFLRVNAKDGVAEGVNTDASPLPLDDNGATQNNALKLSQIPIVVIDGVEYYEIRLDVNEPNSTTNELSLSEIQLFLSTQQATSADVNADRSVTALDGDFTKVFDLDATTDKTLILRDDYSGSGRDDYILYIPVSQVGSLTGVTASNTFVSLYVQFGPTPEDDAGFEEFRVRSSVVVNGVKFADIDGDGVRDTGEGGIGGIKVFLDLDGNGVLSTGDRVTTTAADGSFEFTGLPTSTVSQSYFVYELLTAEQAGQYILTTGNAQGGHLVTISSTGNVSSLAIGNMPIIKDISVVKSVTSIVDGPDATGGNALDGNGDTINYLVSITNTGNVPLTNVNVGDLLEGGIALTLTPVSNGNGDTVLNVGETWTFSASYVLTQADLDTQGGGNSLLDNVATGSAQYNGQTVGPKSDDTHTPLVYNPKMAIEKLLVTVKNADGSTDSDGKLDSPGDVATYSIKVTNTGNVTLEGILVTDDITGNSWTIASLAPGASETVSDTYSVTQAQLDALTADSIITNVATATDDEAAKVTDDATVPVDYDPKIDLEKLVSVNSTNGINGTFVDADSDATNPDNSFLGPLNVNVGTDVWFKVVLDNTGNITLTDVDVVDENTTEGSPGPVFDLMVDGYLTLNAVTNFGATLSGDADNDHQLDVDEVWTITYNQDFDPGQHINTATVTTGEGATDTDDAYYYSLVNQGPGVRTPGFWQNMNNGGQFWDGIAGNEKNAGQTGFAEGELLYAVDSDGPGDGNAVDAIMVDGKGKIVNGGTTAGLLIGDYNMNGVTDSNEDTIFISYNDARTLINANNSQMSNGTVKLGRDVVATWLNYLSGNSIGESTDTESPKHFLDDAIDWFQKYAGKDADTSSTDTFDVLNIAAKNNMTSAGWLAKIDGEHTGGDLHNALDHYNNDGKTEDGGTIYAHDTDDATFMAAMSALQSSGGSGGGAEDSGLLQTQQMIMI